MMMCNEGEIPVQDSVDFRFFVGAGYALLFGVPFWIGVFYLGKWLIYG